MKKKVLHGQGAKPERMTHSNMETGIRELSKGGIPVTYGHRDLEHCALDFLHNKGFIEQNQFQAGYDLRKLYYNHKVTGRWIDDTGKAYEGDVETPSDIAYEAYRSALAAISTPQRGITEHVCVEAVKIPTYYTIIQEITHGLDDLVNYFMKRRKHLHNI